MSALSEAWIKLWTDSPTTPRLAAVAIYSRKLLSERTERHFPLRCEVSVPEADLKMEFSG